MQNADAFCMGDGEGVSDIVGKSEFRFFTFAAPTLPLPHGGGNISAACLAFFHYTEK